jgi:hypothetical protein
MKRITCLLLITFQLFFSLRYAEAKGNQTINRNNCSDSYIKWVDVAKKQARSKYPSASFIDFLYVGCKSESSTTKYHIYKYWMKDGSRQFGVYVSILVDTESNKVINSSTEETNVVTPSYGKWRRIAIESIEKKYPNAEIVDYRPCNCDLIEPVHASMTFKFWLKQDSKWKFVYTTIIYQVKTEKVTSVVFEEKER